MCNALMAINAGLLASEQKPLMSVGRALTLPGYVHRLGAMTIPALKRIIGFQPFPFVGGQHMSRAEELLARADGTEKPTPDFLGGLHLARHLVGPVVRHVTIGAGGPRARAIRVMDS